MLNFPPFENHTQYIKVSGHQFPFSSRGVWGMFPHHQAILDTSWVSCNWTQFWHYLLTDSIRFHRFHRLRAQSYKTVSPLPQLHLQTTVASPGYHLCYSPTCCRSEIPMTPSCVQFICCEWLTELRKPVYLLDYRFITRDLKGSRWTSRRKSCMRGLWASKPSPGMPLSLHLHLLTSPEAFQTLSFRGFTEASWHRRDGLNHWPLVTDSTSSLSSLPGGLKGGAESCNFLITRLVLLASSPHP